MTIMIDAIGANARAVLDQFGPRQPVGTYVNGPSSAWTPQEEALFGLKIRIGVEPGQPDQARFARTIDVERFDARPADVPPFVAERFAAGHRDATPYADVSTMANDLPRFLVAPRLWVAWWWQQGEPTTTAPLLAEFQRFGVTGYWLREVEAKLWAWQFENDPLWDRSKVFGKLDWSR